MAIRIMTDSSADYEPEELAEKGLDFVPLLISFGDESFDDGVDLSKEEFYRKLLTREVFPQTARPAPEKYIPAFQSAKENGDEIIALFLSTGLSSTYQSACMAKDIVDYDGIHILDSLTAVTGLRLLVDTALLRVQEGKSSAEIIEEILDMRGRMTIYAALDTLQFLLMGGRISKTQATLASALNVKPVIMVNAQGGLDVPSKPLGMKRAIRYLMERMEQIPYDPAYPVYFPYSYVPDNAKIFLAEVSKKYPELDTSLLYNLGPTIGSHIGPNGFGFTYVRK